MESSSSTRCVSSARLSCRRCRGTAPRSEQRDVAPPRRATARAAARQARRTLPPGLTRRLPSARSLAVGIGLFAAAVGLYVAARETSMFALRDVKVAGGSPDLQQQVRDALGPELGRSLVAIGAGDVEARLAQVPGVL